VESSDGEVSSLVGSLGEMSIQVEFTGAGRVKKTVLLRPAG